MQDLNLRPLPCEGSALATELIAHILGRKSLTETRTSGQAMRPFRQLNEVHYVPLRGMLTQHSEEGLWWNNALKQQLRSRT